MATSVDTIVVNFGSPRSGTTFMEKTLRSLQGVLSVKLHEFLLQHPCQSRDGLLDLAHFFNRRRLVIIRTVRHPLEIAESFVALRSQNEDTFVHRKKTDAEVVQFINMESVNVRRQSAKLLESLPDRFIEIRYEDIPDPKKAGSFVDEVVRHLPHQKQNHANLTTALKNFGKVPVRGGRLSRGLGRVMAQEQREWFRERLGDVIRREGYAD